MLLIKDLLKMNYHLSSEIFQNNVVALGPFPVGGDDDMDPFSYFVMSKEVGDLEVGECIILSNGAWRDNFVLEAVFITTVLLGPRGALLERIWRSGEVEEQELELANAEAARVAIEEGNLDEAGIPIMPENITPGDVLIPARIQLRTAVEIYALNLAGLRAIYNQAGFHNPTLITPVPAILPTKPLVADPLKSVMGNVGTIHSVSPIISYQVQQATVGLGCFKLLIGRDMTFYEKIISTNQKIDEFCAIILSDQVLVNEYMKKKRYVYDPRQLVLLMTGCFRAKVETGFITLRDFACDGREWVDTAPLWEDLFVAASNLDILFRQERDPFFTPLFSLAQRELNRVTHDLFPQAKFSFVYKQCCALWQTFGTIVRNPSNLLIPIGTFNEICSNLFSFKEKDLLAALQASRDIRVDEMWMDGQVGLKHGRSNGGPGVGIKKKLPLVMQKPPGKIELKGFCFHYYAFLAKASRPQGGLFTDCSQSPACKRFSHAPVTSSNKEAIKEKILVLYPDSRVKTKVEEYLNQF